MTVAARDLSHLTDDEQKIAQEVTCLIERLEASSLDEVNREEVQQSMDAILPRLHDMTQDEYDFMREKQKQERELSQALGAKPRSFLVEVTPLTHLSKLQMAHTCREVASRRYSTLAQLLTDLRQYLERLHLQDPCSTPSPT